MKHANSSPLHRISQAWVTLLGYLCVAQSDRTDRRPFIEGRIEDRQVMMLIDSGAAVTVLNYREYKMLKSKPKLQKIQAQLRTANGNELVVMGKFLLNFTLGKRKFRRECIVVKGLRNAMIIGADTLEDEKLILDAGSRTVTAPRNTSTLMNNIAQINSTHSNVNWRTADSTLSTENWQFSETATPFRNSKETTIPPWSERQIATITDKSLQHMPILISGFNENNVQPAIVEPMCNGRLPIVITNPSDLPLYLPANQQLGYAVQLNENDMENVRSIDSIDSIGPTSEKKDGRANVNKSHVHLNNMPKVKNVTCNDIDLSNVPQMYINKYLDLINRFTDIFSWNPDDIGRCDIIPQKIILKDPNKVASTPPYRTPEHLRPVVFDYVEKLLAAGIIRKSTSPFCSPLLLVAKANVPPDAPLVSRYRVVHDYRTLNQNIIKDAYPMQNLYELIDRVSAAKVWTVIDLSSGFWNQTLDEDSKRYTAFSVPGKGHFEYERSAQGLVNSPSSFQRLLDYIIAGIQGVNCYIDDVIVYSNTHEEQLATLELVFQRFRKYKLKCRLSKLKLGSPQVQYLGYDISQNGIRPGQAKTAAIKGWKPPTSVTEIRQFLGLCSFFRRTISNFAEIASPLTRLTRKSEGWKGPNLPPEGVKAFEKLKESLCSRPCMKAPDFQKEFILTVDASTKALGATLSQKNRYGSENIIAYASRVLTDPERKYSPSHLEALAMLWACKTFKPYLMGPEFLIRTDHKPLLSLTKTQANGLDRIKANLDVFLPYRVEYIKGDKNPADSLSRYQVDEVQSEPSVQNLNWDQIYNLQVLDPYCKALACYLKYGKFPINENFKAFVQTLKERTFLDDKVICANLQGRTVILAPFAVRENLFHICHDNLYGAHHPAERTYQKITQFWWWPKCKQEIEEKISNCHTCASVNLPAHRKPLPLEPLQPALAFNDRVHYDLLGPLVPSSTTKNKYLLVIIDAFSRYVELAAIPDKTTETVASAFLDHWVSRHGAPHTGVSDNGGEFNSEVMKTLCSKLGIKQNFTSSFHPQSNGITERFNRTALNFFRKYLEGTNMWENLLAPLAFSHNTTVHSSTKHSPYFAVYGRIPNMPHMVAFPNARDKYYGEDNVQHKLQILKKSQMRIQENNALAFIKAKEQFDKRSVDRKFEVGDRCYILRPSVDSKNVQQKLRPPYDGPYTIIEKLSHNNYIVLKDRAKHTLKVHANIMKLVSFKQQQFNDHANDEEEKTDSHYVHPTQKAKTLAAGNSEEDSRRPTRSKQKSNRPGAPVVTPAPPSPPPPPGFAHSPASPLRNTPPFRDVNLPEFSATRSGRTYRTPTEADDNSAYTYTVRTRSGLRNQPMVAQAAQQAVRNVHDEPGLQPSTSTNVTVHATPKPASTGAKPKRLMDLLPKKLQTHYHTRTYTSATGDLPSTPDLPAHTRKSRKQPQQSEPQQQQEQQPGPSTQAESEYYTRSRTLAEEGAAALPQKQHGYTTEEKH